MINSKSLYIKSIADIKEKLLFLNSNNYFEIEKEERNAVFDLDNTLLIGDIGDAVFSMLKIMKKPIKLTWKKYLEILKNEGKETAYSRVVSEMAGLSFGTIENATEKVLKSTDKYIEVENISVPVPKAHPFMFELLQILRENSFNIYVISATNIFSVRITCRYFFKIPEDNCFGIEPITKKIDIGDSKAQYILSNEIKKPLTITTGKEVLYWEKISKTRPLITAGDSETDIFLLNLVDSNGFSIWVGDDIKRYNSIKQKSKIPDQFYFLNR